MTKEKLITKYENKIKLVQEKRKVAFDNNLDWGVDMCDREIEKLYEFLGDLKKLNLSN